MENLNEGKKKASAYMAELAEIDKQSAIVAMEAKINKLAEMAEAKAQRLEMVSEDENLSELIDKKAMNEMRRNIKEIERAKLKLEKLYEKMTGGKKKEMVDEEMDDKINPGNTKDDQAKKDDYDYDARPSHMKEGGYGSTTYEEDDVEEGIKDELKKNKGKTWDEAKPAQVTKEKGLAEEYLRMQKLAGVISEEEYKNRLNEGKYRVYMNSDPDEPNEINYEEYFGDGTEDEMIKQAEKMSKDKTNQYGDPIKIVVTSEDNIDDVVWTNQSVNEEEYKNRLNEGYQVDNSVNGKMPEFGDKFKKRITEEYGEDTWQALTKWMDECDKISEKKGWSHWRWSYTKGPSLEKIVFMVEKDKEKFGEADTPSGYFMLPTKKFELPQ